MSWRISRQDYYNFFRAADTNNDGYISMKELKAILHKFDYRGSDSDVNVRIDDVIDAYIFHCNLFVFYIYFRLCSIQTTSTATTSSPSTNSGEPWVNSGAADTCK